MQPHHCNKTGGAHEGIMAALQNRASFTSTICFPQMPMHLFIPCKPAHTVPTTALAAAAGSRLGCDYRLWRKFYSRLLLYSQNTSAGARRARLWGFPRARALRAGRRVEQRARCESRREQARRRENKRLAAPHRRQRRPTPRTGPSSAA